MPLIEAHNLSKTYVNNDGVETPALKDVSLNVLRGEFLAVMGPSGSGKSTLLHLLGLLDAQSSGTYRFDGKSVAEFSDNDLAAIRNQKIGFVFQAFNLMPKTSVFENVMLPFHYSGIPIEEWRPRTESAIASVGLTHRKNHEGGMLSGGEKQRVAIARSLVCDPLVIFADEPTGNLDSKSGGMVMEVLARLNAEEKRTIILITHETYTAEHAHRIIRLRDGRIESDTKIEKRRNAGAFAK